MNEFTSYLQSKDFSKSTQKTHKGNVTRFLTWLGSSVENCRKKDVLAYLERLKNHHKISNQTRSYHLQSIKYYFDYLYQNGTVATNPAQLIKIRNTKTRKLQKVYTTAELDQLFDDYHNVFVRDIDRKAPKNTYKLRFLSEPRNYAILGFFIYQGLVTSEVARLKVDDIDFAKATVKITGKTKGNDRTLPLTAVQIGFLMHYLQNIRPKLQEYFTEEQTPLFLSLSKDGKTTTLEQAFKTLARQLGKLDPELKKLHQLRASRIAHWLKTEGLRKTQYLAGHKSISTTETYLQNDLEQLTKDITQYNPF